MNHTNQGGKVRKIIGYQIVDVKTGHRVGNVYRVSMRNRARSYADKKSNEYGAYRYVARPVFSE
jgi:hypothetical protein